MSGSRFPACHWCDLSQECPPPPQKQSLMQGLMDGDRQLQGYEMAWVDGRLALALTLASCGWLQLKRRPAHLVRRASSKVL